MDAYAKSFGAPCTIRKKADGAADAAALFAFFMNNYNFLFLVRADTTQTLHSPLRTLLHSHLASLQPS